eukprot:2567782-Amphidinium_carterae.1
MGYRQCGHLRFRSDDQNKAEKAKHRRNRIETLQSVSGGVVTGFGLEFLAGKVSTTRDAAAVLQLCGLVVASVLLPGLASESNSRHSSPPSPGLVFQRVSTAFIAMSVSDLQAGGQSCQKTQSSR